ncbi:MAG: universal stress protein, partial [Actinobacteria bacterium]|nr:universal stress protein [Actinomycetota bacterium]
MDEYLWNGRIAVGVDGSPESRTAALWAAQEASQRRCGLTLVHAVLPPVGTSPFGAGMPSGLNPMAEVRRGALTELDEIASTLTAADVQTRIEVGSPSGIMIGASETAALVVV